jgi:3-isopropylmalate dehydrogenase
MGGDGVGPELVAHGVRVLSAVAAIEGLSFDAVEFPHSGAHYRATGELISDAALADIRSLDSLLFGAVGDPELPRGTMEHGLLMAIALRLDLGIGVRPATLYGEHLTPLKGRGAGDIDLVIVRDTSEDVFATPVAPVHAGTVHEVGVGVFVHTRAAVERTIRYAFRLAETRRRRVTLVCQANSLPGHEIWSRAATVVAAEHPDVELREVAPDVGTMLLITEPDELDVIATTCWLGGNLTDAMGAIVGGIGLCASARLSDDGRFGLFEPAHGSAPKYTGLDRVSPMGTIRAVAMMLDTVGEASAARRIEAAIARALGTRRVPSVSTKGPMGTTEATDVVIEELQRDVDGGRAGTTGASVGERR